MSSTKHSISALKLTRQDGQSELSDLVRSRTEIECLIDDLRSSSDLDGGKRASLEAELATVEKQIKRKETELENIIPQWEEHRAKESREKRKAQEAKTQLDALFAKQGRVNRFRTKAERDTFLKNEIASLSSYQTTRSSALESTRIDLETARQSLAEVEEHISGAHGSIDDGRKRAKELGEAIAKLKDEESDLVEQRKELWREDTKLQSLVSHAADEKRSAENNLASMMDKVGFNVKSQSKPIT